MIGLIGRLSAKVSDMSLAARCAWLNGCLLVVLAAALAVAAGREGSQTPAVLIAAAICTLSANAALILAVLWHGTPNGITGALGGSLVGMFPPLFAGLLLQHRGGELAQAGVFGWIVVFYLAALMVKTLLVAPSAAKLPATKQPGAGSSVAGNSVAGNTDDPTCRAGA